jgi:hypothetical protein
VVSMTSLLAVNGVSGFTLTLQVKLDDGFRVNWDSVLVYLYTIDLLQCLLLPANQIRYVMGLQSATRACIPLQLDRVVTVTPDNASSVAVPPYQLDSATGDRYVGLSVAAAA